MRWRPWLGAGWALSLLACASTANIPKPKHEKHRFPKEAMIGVPPPDVNRPYEVLGEVRARANFMSIDAEDDEEKMCQNYFNQAVQKLVSLAKAKGADAVIDVKSVVFLVDGRSELFPRAECADEGGEGQALARGVAIRWKPQPK